GKKHLTPTMTILETYSMSIRPFTVNRDSAPRRAWRWNVQSDVGGLCFQNQATGCRWRTNPVRKRGSLEPGESG
ncbi:MAG: hypothetical protein WCL39_14920, partial [Armatimonadota bacterium]